MRVFFFIFFITFNISRAKSSVVEIDTKKSKIFWSAKNFTKREEGSFKLKSGFITMKNNDFFRNGEFIIDMYSLNCTSVSPIFREKLEKHLKSKDFLWVEKYPFAELKIYSIERKKELYQVEAKLKLRGKKNKIDFKAQISFTNGYPTKINGIFTINRTFWNVSFDGFGQNFISNDVDIEFVIYTK